MAFGAGPESAADGASDRLLSGESDKSARCWSFEEDAYGAVLWGLVLADAGWYFTTILNRSILVRIQLIER